MVVSCRTTTRPNHGTNMVALPFVHRGGIDLRLALEGGGSVVRVSDEKLRVRFDLPHITEFGYLTLVRLLDSAAVRASGARATTSQWLPASLFWL